MKVKDLFKDVQDVELTPEQEKQIKDYLGIKESKLWKPEIGEVYYYIASDGSIVKDRVCGVNILSDPSLNPYDIGRLNYYNYFKTKEEAEFTSEQLKVYTELKRYAAEHNEYEIDWQDKDRDKFFISYNHHDNILNIDWNQFLRKSPLPYFTSMSIAKDAIKAVGDDRIKRYLFGVK